MPTRMRRISEVFEGYSRRRSRISAPTASSSRVTLLYDSSEVAGVEIVVRNVPL